jgi:hypothetical protein
MNFSHNFVFFSFFFFSFNKIWFQRKLCDRDSKKKKKKIIMKKIKKTLLKCKWFKKMPLF